MESIRQLSTKSNLKELYLVVQSLWTKLEEERCLQYKIKNNMLALGLERSEIESTIAYILIQRKIEHISETQKEYEKLLKIIER